MATQGNPGAVESPREAPDACEVCARTEEHGVTLHERKLRRVDWYGTYCTDHDPIENGETQDWEVLSDGG